MDSLKALIAKCPIFPSLALTFTTSPTLLKDATGFKNVIDSLTELYRSTPIDVVLGIEARGFIIAPAVATPWAMASSRCGSRRNCRRAGAIEYQLEYGTDVLENPQGRPSIPARTS